MPLPPHDSDEVRALAKSFIELADDCPPEDTHAAALQVGFIAMRALLLNAEDPGEFWAQVRILLSVYSQMLTATIDAAIQERFAANPSAIN